MSTILDIHPAFGFEWEARWDVAVHQRDEQLRGRGEDPIQYHHRLWGDVRMSLNNNAKILAAIPLMHIIVGIAVLIFLKDEKHQDPVKQAIIDRHILRWSLTIALGPIMTIVDLFQTFLDRQVVDQYLEEHPNIRRGFYPRFSELATES